MGDLTIKDISDNVGDKFWSPHRLNALFMSRVMDDGETMRSIVHGFGCGSSGVANEVITALIEYYETHDKVQLIETMEGISETASGVPFREEQMEDKSRDESQPTQYEFDNMKWLAEYSAENSDKFWSDERLYQKAGIFAKYYGDFFYYNKEGHYVVDETVPVTIYENKMPYTLFDNTDRESNWLNLAKYDEPHTEEIRDDFSSPFPQRKYVNATVIDVLRKTVADNEMANYRRPYTADEALDKVCNDIYDEESLSAPKYVKALTLLNRRMAAALKGERNLNSGDYDAAAMLIDRAPDYFKRIDYVEQFGFYKTEAYKELLKFSFMTTFTKRQRFNEQAMNNYVNAAANAGHWMKAQNLVTKVIVKNTKDLGGINRGILDLNLMRPRPTKFHGMENETMVRIANEYYDRDLERMQYLQLYLKKQPVNTSPYANTSRGPER